MARLLLLGILPGLASAAYSCEDYAASSVTTPSGVVNGFACANFKAYLGVPYGTAGRWQHSSVVAPWATPVDATHDPVGCPQVCTEDEPPHICPVRQSEDCLFLNIYAPAAPPAGSAPVLLFIHGGNFHDGYAGGYELDGGMLYDGQRYVNTTGQIVVVVNYRLGALGFLYLGPSKGSAIEGNFGLQDQVTAMTWVQRNIAAFGGDPARVTLMGQSAGAMSISAHLTRPQTSGLYASVIQHSNPFAEPYRSPVEAQAMAAGFGNYTGCGSDQVLNASWTAFEACLRALPTATIVAAAMSAELDLLADLDGILQVVVAWGPTIGTPYLPLRPLEAFQAGLVNDVPIAVGTTANETVIFVYEVLDFPLSQLLYELAVGVLVNFANVSDIMRLYPVPPVPPADFRVFASAVLTDALFLCPTRNATEALLAAQPFRRSPVYHYQYNHLLSWGAAAWSSNFTECDNEVVRGVCSFRALSPHPPPPPPPPSHSHSLLFFCIFFPPLTPCHALSLSLSRPFLPQCHGSDLPAWFMPLGTGLPGGFGNYTAAELDMGRTWQQYWAGFAATGVMGVPEGGVAWPAYTAANRATLEIRASDDGGLRVLNSVRDVTCAWWDQYGYKVY